jgi:hypothetical protein
MFTVSLTLFRFGAAVGGTGGQQPVYECTAWPINIWLINISRASPPGGHAPMPASSRGMAGATRDHRLIRRFARITGALGLAIPPTLLTVAGEVIE